MSNTNDFGDLSPNRILSSVEKHLGCYLNGTVYPFNSYVNRVYGIQDEDGNRYAVKFYRPGRWTSSAIREEHRFLKQCADEELPVISPIVSAKGESLGEDNPFRFAVFPLRGGRTFDITTEEDWIRLGAVIGRMHRIGQLEDAPERPICVPNKTTENYLKQLSAGGIIHPSVSDDFLRICRDILELINPLFDNLKIIRIHGDCHRGNILDRGPEGLILIDFDDMMTGPPVQDLWLLLPGHKEECFKELELLLEGYEQFISFDRNTLQLIEPLRFMRMIHFLAWCAIQKNEPQFLHHFPEWGSEGFWIKELEDFRYQSDRIRESLF